MNKYQNLVEQVYELQCEIDEQETNLDSVGAWARGDGHVLVGQDNAEWVKKNFFLNSERLVDKSSGFLIK